MTSAKEGRIPRPFSVDMIATTIQAALSIVERNAILKLIPKALWIDAHAKVLEVVRGTAETLVERRAKMLEAFKQMEVAPEELFAALGIESEAEIGLNDMPRLTGMWTALRDGEAAESVLGMAPGSRHRSQHKAVENPMGNEELAVTAERANAEAVERVRQELELAAKPALRRGRPPKSQQAAAAQMLSGGYTEEQSHKDHADQGIVPDGQLEEAAAEFYKRDNDEANRKAEAEQRQKPIEVQKDIPVFLDRRLQNPAAAPAVSEYAMALKFIADFPCEPADLLN